MFEVVRARTTNNNPGGQEDATEQLDNYYVVSMYDRNKDGDAVQSSMRLR